MVSNTTPTQSNPRFSGLIITNYYFNFITSCYINVIINVTDIFIKAVVLPLVDPKTIENNFYLTYLKKEKAYSRCLAMLAPGLLMPGYTMLAIIIYDVFQSIKGQSLYKKALELQNSEAKFAQMKASAACGNTEAKICLASYYLKAEGTTFVREDLAIELSQSAFTWVGRHSEQMNTLITNLLDIEKLYLTGVNKVGTYAEDRSLSKDSNRAELFKIMATSLKRSSLR